MESTINTNGANIMGNNSNPKVSATLRTLIIDNYDSYTFNLLQLFDADQLENVVVIHNNQVEWYRFKEEIFPHFDQVILSPGPGRPERIEDFGICTQILETSHIPVFGVCLGHQGIGWIHGGKVTYGAEPVHGQIAHIRHDGSGLFKDIPQEFDAVRYHSLVVQEKDLPTDLIATAWCYSFPLIPADNLDRGVRCSMAAALHDTNRTLGAKSIMGIRHKTLPHHGVQFHPESICTQYGKQMMANFFAISSDFYSDHARSTPSGALPDHVRALSIIATAPALSPSIHSVPSRPAPDTMRNLPASSPYSLYIHGLDSTVFPDPEVVFSRLFLTGPRSKAASWWLDSARQPHPMSRFSFMGGVETRQVHRQPQSVSLVNTVPGSSQAVFQYSTLHNEINVRRYDNDSMESSVRRIHLNPQDKDSSKRTFWDWASRVMNEFSGENVEATFVDADDQVQDFEKVPFDFFAGLVGYFGYEMKRESLDGYSVPAEQLCKCDGHRQETLSQQTAVCQCDCIRKPDASFVLATQAVVFDHVDKRVYVLGIVNNGAHNQCKDVGGPVGFETTEKCQQWIQEVTQSIIYLAASPSAAGSRRKSINLLSNGPTTTGATSTLPHIPFLVKQRHRRQSSAGILAPFQVDVTEQDYLNAIRDSLNYIHEGESYEICLTTQFRAHIPLFPTFDSDDSTENDLTQGDPAFDLYKILRKLNPAPFSVYLSIPTVLGDIDTPSLDRSGHVGKIIILSSSPERFLKVGRRPSDEVSAENSLDISATSRTVEMKPIKGTVAVAKGCFCKEDEGCGVHEQDDDGSEHTCDGDEIDVDDIATQAVKPTSNGRPLRRDRCAEARRRENQNRVDSLSKNIKERAENLMIVDLIRNDLAHVCRSHSVRVPYLMHVESYETVHQLVTTVRGELFDHIENTQAVRACFPPGSMTGAPKLRSVQLLDSLEGNVTRGVYSGCLGYIGISAVAARSKTRAEGDEAYTAVPRRVRTAVDMSVVIRTAVLSVLPSNESPETAPIIADASIGAGGALTILSDMKEEWREVLLKSRSVVPSVLSYLRQNSV